MISDEPPPQPPAIRRTFEPPESQPVSTRPHSEAAAPESKIELWIVGYALAGLGLAINDFAMSAIGFAVIGANAVIDIRRERKQPPPNAKLTGRTGSATTEAL